MSRPRKGIAGLLLISLLPLPVLIFSIARNQKFYVLTKPGSIAYRHLLSPEDEALLPLLASFQKLSTYRRVTVPEHLALAPEEQRKYYGGLIEKFIGKEARSLLNW